MFVDQLELSDLEVEVVTWIQPHTARPLARYDVKAEVIMEGMLIEKSTVTDDDGKAFIPALVWLGAKLNISVKPENELVNPGSDYHRELLKSQGVDYVDRSNESVKSSVPVEKKKIALTVDKISPNLPFEVRVDYTAVTAVITDALGRPLPGAWVALVDVSTGLLAGWSYTNWSGHTSLINVPVSEGEDGEYSVQAHYLGEGLQGKPVWPFGAYGVWPCIYDSWLDEQLNKSITVYGLYGRHLNITTHVYKTELNFFYGRRIPIDVSVVIHPKHLRIENVRVTQGTVGIERLPRGLYGVTAKWADIVVGSDNVNVTKVGGGHFLFEMNVAVYDLNLTIKDAANTHTVPDVECEIHDPLGRITYAEARAGRLIVQRLPKGYYAITFNWISPYTGERIDIASFAGNISYLASNTEIYTNTYDVAFAVRDGNGRPVSGVTIMVGRRTNPTNPMGEAVFTLVPAGEYQVTVSKEHIVLEKRTIIIHFSFRNFSFTLPNLLDLNVKVVDQEGRPIDSVVVMLRKGDEIVASSNTNEQGLATLSQMVVDNYTVEATYDQFTGKLLVMAREFHKSTPIVIELPLSQGTVSTTQTTTMEGGLPDGTLVIIAVVVVALVLIVLVVSQRLKRTVAP
ncbi:MAG: hypothetical protein ACETV0_03095 [Nitrososphaeria archaeon]